MQTTDTVEASDGVGEMSVPASPPQLPILQNTMTSSMNQAMTSSVIYASQMEADTVASPLRNPQNGFRECQPQEQRGPDIRPAWDHRESGSEDQGGAWPRTDMEAPAGPSRLGWTWPGAAPRWDPIETGTWEELEEAPS